MSAPLLAKIFCYTCRPVTNKACIRIVLYLILDYVCNREF